MATPSQLMTTVSHATGVPLATIVDIDRRLVTGGLRTKGGRGFNAARMTPLDAACLLTAVLGSPHANAAVDAVERYGHTKVDKARSEANLFAATGLDDLAALPARHGFVDALAAFIASASTGDLARRITQSKNGWTPRVEVFAFTRATRGRIRLAALADGGIVSVEYALAPIALKPGRARKGDKPPDADEQVGDLEQSRRVTDRTLLPIAQLLAEESQRHE